jgi:hypothetical protein
MITRPKWWFFFIKTCLFMYFVLYTLLKLWLCCVWVTSWWINSQSLLTILCGGLLSSRQKLWFNIFGGLFLNVCVSTSKGMFLNVCVCVSNSFWFRWSNNFLWMCFIFGVISWNFKAMKSMCISNSKVGQNISSNKFLVSHYILYDFIKVICKREIQF